MRTQSQSVAVLWGAGGAFCAGFDLKYAAGLMGERRPLSALDFPAGEGAVPRGPMGPTRLALSKPVIAAVAGPAVAGGMELALWCDLRVMEETAYMGVYCRRWGVPLIDGGTVRLPRIVGRGPRARHHPHRPQGAGRGVLAHRACASGWCRTARAARRREALAHEIARFPQGCLRADRRSVWLQEGLSEARRPARRVGLLGRHGRAGRRRRRRPLRRRQGPARGFRGYLKRVASRGRRGRRTRRCDRCATRPALCRSTRGGNAGQCASGLP